MIIIYIIKLTDLAIIKASLIKALLALYLLPLPSGQ